MKQIHHRSMPAFYRQMLPHNSTELQNLYFMLKLKTSTYSIFLHQVTKRRLNKYAGVILQRKVKNW